RGRRARRPRPRARRGPARERTRARGADGGDRQPEPPLQGARGRPGHRRPVISVVPVEGLPEVEAGADLGALIARAVELEDGDVVVVAQKVVSKAERRVVALADVEPSAEARALADGTDADPRHVETILRETV